MPLVLATALAFSACGSDTKDTSAPDSTAGAADSTAASSVASDFNDADVTFAQSMIPHHEQAVEMAAVALEPTVGAGPAVQDLATRIKGAQDPEIELMTGWLVAWNEPMEMGDGHDMGSMDGMMSAEDMDALAKLTGDAFDRQWLEMMVEHHTGAIDMADAVETDGANGDVKALAGRIIVAQRAEIDQMNELLGA